MSVSSSNSVPTIDQILTQRVVVGVSDLAASDNQSVTLSTFGLGSCIGLAMYDSKAKAGALLHFMLPDSRLMPQKAQEKPAMFADTGIELLLETIKRFKVQKENLQAFFAGGATVISEKDIFKIGTQNTSQIKYLLEAHNIPVISEDTGGKNNRTLHFKLSTGELIVKSGQTEKTIQFK